jgi:transposase
VFSREVPAAGNEAENTKEKELYSKIGELQVQVDFLKKVLGK